MLLAIFLLLFSWNLCHIATFAQASQVDSISPQKDWAVLAGQSSIFLSQLSTYLESEYRIVSVELASNSDNSLHLAAVLQKHKGPVWTITDRISKVELLRKVEDNEKREFALTDVCGATLHDRIVYPSLWQKYQNVSTELWFPSGAQDSFFLEKLKREAKGYRLTRLCGFEGLNGTTEFVAVWQRPTLSTKPQEVIFNRPLSDCIQTNSAMENRNFIPVLFQAFRIKSDIRCNAIYEQRPGATGRIEMGTNVEKMTEKLKSSGMVPQQISSYLNSIGQRQYIVLCTTAIINRYPVPYPVWHTNTIPIIYYRNSNEQFPKSKTDFIEDKMRKFMIRYDIPAVSFAVSYNESLKLAFGMGLADIRTGKQATAESLYRIASISKPITAVAIFKLVEAGSLQLDSPVFGPSGILGTRYGNSVTEKHLNRVTVRHLLEHTVGAWPNGPGDTAFQSIDKSADDLIADVLKSNPLEQPPGDLFVYSNFGYLLLGKVIEAVSKLSYEQFVEANIFQPTGVFDAQVGGDLVGDALPNEVVYYMSPSSGNPYDLPSMKRNGPFAGWVASPIDLLRLMSHLDGFTNKVDILSPESIALLSSATIVSDEAYSRGWVIGSNGWNGWLHSGILPGAASLLVRLDNGVTFAVAMNSEINQKGLQNFWMSIHYLMHHIIDSLDQYPDNDLF